MWTSYFTVLQWLECLGFLNIDQNIMCKIQLSMCNTNNTYNQKFHVRCESGLQPVLLFAAKIADKLVFILSNGNGILQ